MKLFNVFILPTVDFACLQLIYDIDKFKIDFFIKNFYNDSPG